MTTSPSVETIALADFSVQAHSGLTPAPTDTPLSLDDVFTGTASPSWLQTQDGEGDDAVIEGLLDYAQDNLQENSHEIDQVIYPLELALPSMDITKDDVLADPILASIARRQRSQAPSPPKVTRGNSLFRARPAPPSTTASGLGPRMTKAAALRLGLMWLDPRDARRATAAAEAAATAAVENVTADPAAVLNDFGNKRERSFNVAALSSPIVIPRQNRAAILRAGGVPSPIHPVRDMAEKAAANKARDAAERLMRRKSVALPASLGAPSITPRTNRSAALRTGATPKTPSSLPRLPRSTSALTLSTTAANISVLPSPVRPVGETKLVRRTTIGPVKSLGTPSIAPRLNRAAMLRAPGLPASGSNKSLASPVRPPQLPVSKLVDARSALSSPSKSTGNPLATLERHMSPPAGPRPTKSSLLRQGLGAKVTNQRY